MSQKEAQIFDSLLPEHRQRRHQVHAICQDYERSPSKGHLKKLKQIFRSVGDKVFIEKGFYCDYGDKITIGHEVYFNINCTLLDGGEITIGDHVKIGPNVQIITVNHPIDKIQRRENISLVSDIHIGNDVWIGAGAIILPGVTIADEVVIGAGSVVTKSLHTKGVYAGNPARRVK